jgi:hypothetical protein
MIKLFRNTRRKLLSENKFSKYLAYAIGEIFLVVVGILIALWINSMNQERINEAKAITILNEIQRDLKKDINEAKSIINRFITHDSIAKLIFWDKLTADEMFSDETKSYGIVFQDITFKTSENGYVNFKRNLNNIPIKYNSISNKLKDLYDTKRADVEARNEVITSNVLENLDKVNRFDWQVASLKGSMPDEAKNYFMRDLEFKKIVSKYMNSIQNVFIATEICKRTAISIHNDISKILNIDDYIPNFPSFESSLDSLDKKNILGLYKLKESSRSTLPEIIELRVNDNILTVFSEKYPEFKYYWHNKNTFVGMLGANIFMSNIKFTKSKNIEFYVSADKSDYAYYTKVKD